MLPTSGAKILTIFLDKAYVGEPIKDTIGRSGISGLWTLGWPYNLGAWASELFKLKHSPCVIFLVI